MHKKGAAKMPVVRIVNPKPYDWRGTQCFIDGNKVPRVKSVDFHVAVDKVPTFVFEMMAEPDIQMEALVQISFNSQSITDAISVLRHELLQHGEIYHGFKASLKSALEKVLDIAEKNNVSQEEMPKAIVVISDMEIDYCGNKKWTFYDKMEKKFRKAGYIIPNIIFWNVDSRHDVFHADATRKGVQLASGQSVTVFKQVLQNLGYNPIEAMENTINSERYDCITVE